MTDSWEDAVPTAPLAAVSLKDDAPAPAAAAAAAPDADAAAATPPPSARRGAALTPEQVWAQAVIDRCKGGATP